MTINSNYYHREYKNDFQAENHVGKRTIQAALPFLTLYKPLSFPISLALGGARTINCLSDLIDSKGSVYHLFQTTIAVISLAATIFAHPLGMIITSAHDLYVETAALIKNLREGNQEKARENCLAILTNSLYLALLIGGGMEVTIAFLAFQVLVGIYYSYAQFEKGKYIEAVSQGLMSVVRGFQAVALTKTVKEPEFDRDSVGKLGEKWQFPSDHLPVGAKVGNARIVTWNVLNRHYMSWVYENSQGLKGSMLTELDRPSPNNPKITMREELVIQHLLEMMKHSNSIIALQECSPEFLKALSTMAPPHMGIVYSDPSFKLKDQNVLLYDKNSFSLLSSEVVCAFPESDPRRTLLDVIFEENATGLKYQVINAHLPGDPTKPGPRDFANYVYSASKPDHIVAALGDMNFDESTMQDAFLKAGETPFNAAGRYNTNIEPKNYHVKNIDHIWVKLPEGVRTTSLSPDEVIPGMQETVDQITLDYVARFYRNKEMMREYYERAMEYGQAGRFHLSSK